MFWIEYFVTVHYSNQVFCIGEVDNIVSITWKHVDGFNLIAAHLKLYHFVSTNFAFLNETMSCNDNEKLPFCMMPMLTFGDARLRDVNAYLPTVKCVKKFGERPTVIYIHLQRKGNFLLGQITQIGRV